MKDKKQAASTKEARKEAEYAMGLVQQSRDQWREITAKLTSLDNTAKYTAEHRAKRKTEEIAAWRGSHAGVWQDNAARLAEHQQLASARLQELQDVAPETLTARAAVLAPVLQNAHQNTDALIRAYRANFDDPASRKLIEDSADLVRQTFVGPDFPGNAAFPERWDQLQREMQPRLPEAEKEAIAAAESYSRTAGYLEAAAQMLDYDLAQLSGENPRAQNLTTREFARVSIQAFENSGGETLDWKKNAPAPQPTPEAIAASGGDS